MATSTSIPPLAPIGLRQYQPLLSTLQRPGLVKTQGFIDGKWIEAHGNDHFVVVDPATEQEVARVVSMGEEDTRDAIAAASTAQRQWKKTTPPVRAKLLKAWAAAIAANSEDLAVIGSVECGKPLLEAKWEVEFAVGVIEYFSHEIVRSSGFLISPIQPNQKILVMKEPVAGVINVITAPRERSEEVGRALTSSNDVRKITLAGSTQVGKWLLRHSSETVKSLSLELGGNAPFIVFEDADLEKALDGLIRTKFSNTGQACIASNRIFVHSSMYETFASEVVKRVKALKMGLPLEEGVQLGPLVGPSAVKKVTGLVGDAVAHGAKVLLGGKSSGLGKNFYEATVLSNLNQSMRIWSEEIFGPVVPLFVFSSEEEVIGMANDTPAGLAGYFYTQDAARMFRVAGELECGMVGVNSELVTHIGAPFGGMKQSGIGREGSREGLEEYLETKMVCIGGL
ncbi:hypothetical protein PRIC1_000113 [Phytophthora ramorum]